MWGAWFLPNEGLCSASRHVRGLGWASRCSTSNVRWSTVFSSSLPGLFRASDSTRPRLNVDIIRRIWDVSRFIRRDPATVTVVAVTVNWEGVTSTSLLPGRQQLRQTQTIRTIPVHASMARLSSTHCRLTNCFRHL